MPKDRLPSERLVARRVEQLLAERLPSGWSLRAEHEALIRDVRIDLVATIASASGGKAALAVEVKRTIEPRDVDRVADQVSLLASQAERGAVPVVAASYLSPRSRQLLDRLEVGYIDTTGNVRIEVSEPGLFISTSGADRDPWPQDDELQSLRGRGAARAVRAIIDSAPPFGVRELAAATGTSAATLSRVLELLERDAIVKREWRGPVLKVDWQAAIRRWSQDYDQTNSNTATTCLEPRGIPALEKALTKSELRYAATGAFAAQRFDPIAPARVAALYVDDAYRAADVLALREADAGANVVLLEPFDPVVFDRCVTRDKLRCVAPSQLAVDLLTGPGREPPQGEELLRWMQSNEDAWRSEL